MSGPFRRPEAGEGARRASLVGGLSDCLRHRNAQAGKGVSSGGASGNPKKPVSKGGIDKGGQLWFNGFKMNDKPNNGDNKMNLFPAPTNTYATHANAERKILKEIGEDSGIRYLIAATEGGRFFPVAIGTDKNGNLPTWLAHCGVCVAA